MEDKLKEKAESGVVDSLLSTAKAALAVGAGAAFLYRNGGGKFLTEAYSASTSILNGVRQDMAGITGRKIETTDIKRIYQNAMEGEDSYLKQGIAHVQDGPFRFRGTSEASHLGSSVNAYNRLSTMSARDMARPEFEFNRIINPVATQFAQQYGRNEREKHKVGQFVEDVFKNLKEYDKILNSRAKHGLEGVISDEGIDVIKEALRHASREAEPDFDGFVAAKAGVRNELEAINFAKETLERTLEKQQSTTNKVIDTALGDRMLTYGDVLDNPEAYRGTNVTLKSIDRNGKEHARVVDAVEFAQEFEQKIIQHNKGKEAEAVETFRQIAPDARIRLGRDGKATNFIDFAEDFGRKMDDFASSMPGKIFKIRDIRETSRIPSFETFNPSLTKANRIMANEVNEEHNRHTLYVDKQVYMVNGRYYTASGDTKLREIEGMRGMVMRTQHGAGARLINSLVGNESYKTTSGNKFLDKLDLAKDGQPHILEKLVSSMKKHKDPEFNKNALSAFTVDSDETWRSIQLIRGMMQTTSSAETMEALTKQASILHNQANIVNGLFKKTTYAPGVTDTIRLANELTDEAKPFAQMAALHHEDLFQAIKAQYGAKVPEFESPELTRMIQSLINDPRKARNTVILKDDPNSYYKDSNVGNDLSDQLRVELLKEAMLVQGRTGGHLESIREAIDAATSNVDTKKNMNRIADWAVLQKQTGVGAIREEKSTAMDLLGLPERMTAYYSRGKGDTEGFYSDAINNLEQMKKDSVSLLGSDYGVIMRNGNIEQAMEQSELIQIRKGISPLDLLRDINNEQLWKSFGKQFYAGRDNLEDVTTYTLFPYFFTERLSSALSGIGMSLSTENKGNVGAMVRAMVLQRGLPIIGGMQALDYTNDMFGVLTGQTVSATLLSGVANIDLGVRKFTDATGLSEWLDDEKDLNPFYRYWTGDDYQTYEERKDWYENGYQEMRKGRWWSFGGIQEFRGSQVQYYQPNWLRRATSDWKDEALYNNVFDKWSHSWMPTPTNPLSPLIYMMDPYWMERRFADERPYPMTGKMFTEETPWGPILNATVGEIIKPQKLMHQDRLGSNFVDSLVLLERENQEIRQKAMNQSQDNLIRFKDGAIEAITYTNTSAPTPSERIVSVQNGQMIAPREYGEHYGVLNAADVYGDNPLRKGISDTVFGEEGATDAFGSMGFGTVDGLSFEDTVAISAAGGSKLAQLAQGVIDNRSMDQLRGLNDQVYARAQENAKMAAIGMPEGDGIINTESIYRAGAKFGDSVLRDTATLNELKGLSAGDDFLGEMAYSLRFAAGIYGYGSSLMIPSAPTTKLADASDITSPVRGFWDANLGGIGGGYFEIFRRFIPAANHKQTDFNPLLNTMPDWMPEKFRFGDPYAALPKGEMRMPGRGFESLHELHPDQYGNYGAFDRMKILADIAPTSHEYKVWRDIADRTVVDQDLRDQMEDIKDRVAKQGKAYDFFDYRFLGKSASRDTAYIDKVTGRDTFTVVGDDREFRLAGIEVTAKKDEFSLEEILQPGMQVLMTTDDNKFTSSEENFGKTTTSAVITLNKENLNKQLLKMGVAEEREDNSAAMMGNYTDFQILRGKTYEALSHLPVVYLSQKFFRIRDPLESWKQEMVYGTSYASWANPIDTFLKPALERSVMSDVEVLVGAAAGLGNKWVAKNVESSSMKHLSQLTYMLSNRGAMIGGFIGIAGKGWSGAANRFMDAGALVQGALWLATRNDQPIEATIGTSLIGTVVGDKIGDVGKGKGAMIGAIAGLAYTGMNTSLLTDGLRKEYIPERTRERWEMQEYFDRLTYVKYKGLYEKAARVAERKEGVDIREMVQSYDQSREENFELRERLEEAKDIVSRAYGNNSERGQRLKSEIDWKLGLLDDQEFTLSVGEYGKSALMYKQLMDSTLFGLSRDASWAELVRSVPQNERNHFIEFFKEKDPRRQREILKLVSPYTAKALKIAWGQEPDEVQSNESYFKDNRMPAPTWSGWRPDVDLKDVQLKTVQNEGMLLADFGFYESQLRDSEVINAPNISPHEGGSMLTNFLGLKGTLAGLGLTGVNVSVMPTSRTGIEVVADIVDMTIGTPAYLERKISDMISF